MELTNIRGINEKRRDALNKLGIFNTADLVRFFPRDYLDLRECQPLKNAYHNDMTLTTGTVVTVPRAFVTRRRLSFVKIECEQEGLSYTVVWFNQPYVLNKLCAGAEYLFYGRVVIKDGIISLTNPSFEPMDKNFRLKGIVPRYVCGASLTQRLLRESVRLAVNVEKPKSVIPVDLQKKYGLSDLYSAYRAVHNPESFSEKDAAADRIATEEYFALISAFRIIKGDTEQVRTNRYSCTAKELLEFISRFPFEFTKGQKDSVNKIFFDLTGMKNMNRLLQGDVGSGKTAVSLCAIFMAVKSGYQAVMLAPTEVLARQSFEVINRYLYDYNVDILVGSMAKKDKKYIKDKVENGLTNVLVGTHAVLEEDLRFKKLSLCVCDEQQRFGVAQRSALSDKGSLADVLVMSATPIPRTLALIFYGDLDVTAISDKPANRVEIQTNVVPREKYADMLTFITKEIKSGRQAYFVCPKIDGDEEGSVLSVTEVYESLAGALSGVKIGLLHGRLKADEKQRVMDDFKKNRLNAIVSTTVIEVGVDVPNATVMVIYNAERFGLSQLHQLRGRVGRGENKSYCFLLTDSMNDEKAKERLSVLVKNSDGFKISEEDFRLRGGGDFLGVRQSGKFMRDLGALNYSTESIFLAKKLSDETFGRGGDLSGLREIAMKKYEKLKEITLN